MTEIIIALISAGIPAIVTIITSNNQKHLSKMHSARSSILTLMLEDRIRIMNNQSPINYKSVLYELDNYVKNNGNSYIKEKVEEYKKIVHDFEKSDTI